MKNFDLSYEVEVEKVGEDGEPELDGKGRPVMETVVYSREERAKRERSFVIGGEAFTFRPAVAPERVIRWSKMGSGDIPGLTEELAIEIFDETVVAFLDPGLEDLWRKKVRDPDAVHPLNVHDIRALIRWLFEQTSGRPTAPPSASSAG